MVIYHKHEYQPIFIKLSVEFNTQPLPKNSTSNWTTQNLRGKTNILDILYFMSEESFTY